MTLVSQSPADPDRPFTATPEPPRVLALCSRKEEDFQCLRTYLLEHFQKDRVTCLLPDSFARDRSVDHGAGHILTYSERGRESLFDKVDTVLHLRRGSYQSCVLPLDRKDIPRYDRLFLLLFLMRFDTLLILDPTGCAQTSSKAELFRMFRQSRARELSARWMPRIRSVSNHLVQSMENLWYAFKEMTETMEGWIGERFDVPAWFFLTGLAHVRRRLRLKRVDSLPEKQDAAGGNDVRREGRGVAHFVTSFGLGGAQRQLQTFLATTSPVWPCADLFVYDPFDSPFDARFTEMGMHCTRIRVLPEGSGQDRLLRFLWKHFPITLSVLRLRSILKSKGKVAILHSWEFRANTIGAVAAALAGTPVILSSVRNMSYWKKAWDHQWWHRWADRLTAGLNDRIVVNATAVKTDYQKWAHIPGERIVTIFNGLDPTTVPRKDETSHRERKKELGWDSRTLVIGWVGRLTPQKDPEMFLRFARSFLDEHGEAGFLILGDGMLLPDLKQRCHQLKLDHNVRFLGARLDVYRWMLAMDVFVMTSIIEGMPNVLIEAQLMGIPCVATDAGGASEVVENGRTGFVVPVGDLQGLQDRCSRLLADASLRNRFTAAGRERAEKSFHAEAMARQTIQLYDRLLEERERNWLFSG